MRNINVALVGAGAIAETHLVNLSSSSQVKITSIVDIDLERAKQISANNNIKHYFTDINEMTSNVKVDAVIICTPNQTHIPIAKIAADQGIHVFMEKPIGTNLKEVQEYLKLAETKNVITMIGMTHRFRSDAAILKEYADRNAFGNIYYAKAKLFRRRGTPKGWFTNKALSGGGAMMDIGVHVLDLAWWLLGKPKVDSITGHTLTGLGKYDTKQVSSWESKNKRLNANDLFDVEDFGAAWIRFKNKTVLSLEVAWAMNGEQDDGISIEILGDKGGAALAPLTLFREEEGTLVKSNPLVEKNNPFQSEIDHFIECIQTGAPPSVDGEQGYQVLKMLQAIYQSSEEKREIHFY
ncbi:oxidoreductase [Virgibacillus indicus]|uniref:Oxidoreductase n=1 Tax=Virgibacillus indicus TaxID=2024554 RepID=A0A265N941_9BACI|nr:Gfo/Idh/MocA family oxidoreductase [Virgibacillus indicus]OZU88335.1 oxidoreductase [Virgibacillus indicus]